VGTPDQNVRNVPLSQTRRFCGGQKAAMYEPYLLNQGHIMQNAGRAITEKVGTQNEQFD
jgi:Holliday junction resolvasome RuvABC ATP-dependent DNA helicase subunit